jgi:hypothetical protein
MDGETDCEVLGRPGPDRVVIDGECEIAGVITHTGADGNAFVACEGTSKV